MQSEYFILDVYFILFFRELVCILVGDYLFASNLYLYTRGVLSYCGKFKL
jgi:hypothetical protein